MCRTSICVVALVLGSVTPGSGRADDPVKDVGDVLVSGQWVKDLGNPPLQLEQHVYTFGKDGHYTYKLVTDHNTPTVTGQWELAGGKYGKVLLRLKDQKGQKDYYWLQQESIVRYDPKKDVLLVSGELYVGEVPLQHVKNEEKAAAQDSEKAFSKVVTIAFPKGGYTLTLAEAAKGVKLEYEIVVHEDYKGVMPLPFGPSFAEPAGPSGLFPREAIAGAGHGYCLLDFGVGQPPTGKVATLKKGTYTHAFEWDGRNWSGPSDFGNPKGKPFPAGTYDVTVTAHGKLVTDKGQVPYEIKGKTKLVLK